MPQSAVWQFSLHALHALAWLVPLGLVLAAALRYGTLKGVVALTAALTWLLVALGAYVRLTDAGLGCPDWPGCYGKLTPLHAEEEILAAHRQAPAGPVSAPKAWNEMLHRYLATLVGALIVAVLLRTVLERRRQPQLRRQPGYRLGLPLGLLAVVILQGLFGKWTVTLLLKPAIVTLHLLGGMLTLSLLVWLAARHWLATLSLSRLSGLGLRGWSLLALIAVALQIALGGWVSTNYAALACIDFPTCHGEWVPDMDFEDGFHLVRELGMTVAGEPLSNPALNAIHWAHRVGAAAVTVIVGLSGVLLLRRPGLRAFGAGLLMLLVAQIALGVANVVTMLPLPVAVAHNAVAALLLSALVMLNFALRPPSPL
jgi:cytochrome c oxidase assembly protein subunit 15